MNMEVMKFSEESDTEIKKENEAEHETISKPNCIGSQSILTILQDKNKFISLLKQQIQNQKIQLQFYLHRGLSSPIVTNFVNSCIPTAAEENLQVNLALNKFCKQNGIKSRIACLHDRMINVEKRLFRIANNQEDMVNRMRNSIINNLSDEIIIKILESTKILRTELEAFRTCCNRLILIEDERNYLVEQVYSIPIAERMNYDVLLSALHEKFHLEKEVMEIRKDQQALIVRLNTMKQPQSHGDNTSVISVHPQRKKLGHARLKEVNEILAAKVVQLEEDVQYNKIIENKIDQIFNEYCKFQKNSITQLTDLQSKLTLVTEENRKLHSTVAHCENMRKEIQQLQDEITEMEAVRKERDYLINHAKDLEMIYKEHKQPDAELQKYETIIQKQLKQIEDSETKLLEKEQENMSLRRIINQSDTQIQELLLFIKRMECNGKVMKSNQEPNNKMYRDFGCNSDGPEAFMHQHCTKFQGTLNTDKKQTKYIIEQRSDPVTTVNIQTINSNGITEKLKAIIESTSPVDGVIQLTNSSAFTLHLSCGAQLEPDNHNVTQNASDNEEYIRHVNYSNLTNKIKCSTIVMDEFELMKDSSNEVVFTRLPSINHKENNINDSEISHAAPRDYERLDVSGPRHSCRCVFTQSEIKDIYSDSSSTDMHLDQESQSDDVSFRDRLKQVIANNVIARDMFNKLFSEPTEQYCIE